MNEMKPCPHCSNPLYPVYDNTGFKQPNPTHEEIIYYQCRNRFCGFIDDTDFMNDKKALAKDVL